MKTLLRTLTFVILCSGFVFSQIADDTWEIQVDNNISRNV